LISKVLKHLNRHVLIACIMASACVPISPSTSVRRDPVSRHPEPAPRRSARPDAPELKKLPNGRYRVRKPWTVDLNGHTWHVPKGYSSNGITAPSRVKSSLGDGVSHEETWAALFHDWLFTQPGISRSQADKLFYDLLIAYGVSSSKARLMYTTVSAYSLTKSVR
jgi:hypothetical protein